LLDAASVGKTRIIRHRMIYIVALGLITSALSLVALARALGLVEAQREARAREAVAGELDRLASLPASPEVLSRPPMTTYVGLHAGWIVDGDQVSVAPEGWRTPIEEAVRASLASRRREVRRAPIGPATLIAEATPTPHGALWAAVLLQPSSYMRPWRWIVFALALATAVLVATAIRVAWAFRKSSLALSASLAALAKDLNAPVPRPSIEELGGIAAGIRALANDLREARAGEERLSRELSHKERLAALGRVAAGVAHEVRNPLASIKLRLDLTAASAALPDEARTAVRAASDEIVRLDRLVSDLLLVAGKQAGPRRSIEVGRLVRARADALEPWSRARGVDIQVDGEGEAVADPDSVARALDNVLRNAVEASPARAVVGVHVAVEKDRVAVLVEDRGEGVDAARTGELFEPFFTTKSDGTGLGLAISRAIARAHGGELTYARDGDITRFSLSLPCKEVA
jgi:signal transduction histidine kinase